MSVRLPSISRKLTEMTLLSTSIHTVLLAKEYLSFPLLLQRSSSLVLNATKSSIPFGCVQCQPYSWRFYKVEKATRKSCKTFDSTNRSDEKRHAYNSYSPHTLYVIAKAKWHETSSSLSRSLKSAFSILRSVVGSAPSSFFSNFAKVPFLIRKSASVYAIYLKSPFSLFLNQKLCVA